MPFRRSSVNNRRSINASDNPFCFAISISFWFAARMRSACCSNCSAIILSARFFSVVFNCAKIKAASLACLPICANIIIPFNYFVFFGNLSFVSSSCSWKSKTGKPQPNRTASKRSAKPLNNVSKIESVCSN